MDFFNLENFRDYLEYEGTHPMAQSFLICDMIFIKVTLCVMLKCVEILGFFSTTTWLLIFIIPLLMDVFITDEHVEELLQDLRV